MGSRGLSRQVLLYCFARYRNTMVDIRHSLFQAVMECVVNPPKPGDASYDQFEKVISFHIELIKRNSVPDWGIPSSNGIPLCSLTLFVLFPLPKVAFLEVKHNE